MGKRLIRRGVRNTQNGVRAVEATDFGDNEQSTESRDVQHTNELPNENSGSEHRSEFIEPESFARDSSDGNDTGTGDTGSKRRGRRKGTRNKQKAAESPITQRLLFSIHMMGSAYLKNPYLMLTEDESKSLADAIAKVQEQYEISFLTEKQTAWIELGIVAAGIYGPRVVAMVNDKKMQKLQKQRENQPMIVSMPDLNEIKRQQNVQVNQA